MDADFYAWTSTCFRRFKLGLRCWPFRVLWFSFRSMKTRNCSNSSGARVCHCFQGLTINLFIKIYWDIWICKMRARQAIYGKPTAARSKPTTRGDRQSRQRPKGQLRQTRLPLGSVASRLRAEGRQRQANNLLLFMQKYFQNYRKDFEKQPDTEREYKWTTYSYILVSTNRDEKNHEHLWNATYKFDCLLFVHVLHQKGWKTLMQCTLNLVFGKPHHRMRHEMANHEIEPVTVNMHDGSHRPGKFHFLSNTNGRTAKPCAKRNWPRMNQCAYHILSEQAANKEFKLQLSKIRPKKPIAYEDDDGHSWTEGTKRTRRPPGWRWRCWWWKRISTLHATCICISA